MNVIAKPLQVDETLHIADIDSEDLFGDNNIITISHHQMIYTLRITRQGKLLLTK